MTHVCHAPGCKRQVPPHMFACAPHWRALPVKIQRAIWREYRPGQETDKKPSLRYLAVQRLACAHSVFRPDSEKAVLAALPFVAEAMDFRKKSIAAGLGDPLETLVPKDGPLWPEAKVRGRS